MTKDEKNRPSQIKLLLVGGVIGLAMGLIPTLVVATQMKQNLAASAKIVSVKCGQNECNKDSDCRRRSGVGEVWAIQIISPSPPKCMTIPCTGSKKVCVK